MLKISKPNLCMTVSVLAIIFGTASAHAEDSAAAKIKALEAQMNAQQTQLNEVKAQLATAKTKAASDTPAQSTDSGVKITFSPMPKFESTDGQNSLAFKGKFQTDAAAFVDDATRHPNSTSIRRAEFGVAGKLFSDWGYTFVTDFAGNAVTINEAYLSYDGLGSSTQIRVGNTYEPFSLETSYISSGQTTFVEKAGMALFVPGRKVGAEFMSGGSNWSVDAGVFGNGAGTASTDDEAISLTGRGTFAPIAEPGKVLHLGVAGSLRSPETSSPTATFASRPDTSFGANAITTGTINNVSETRLYGVEALGIWNSFSLQSEYAMAQVDRNAGSTYEFDGWYATASYFLTGETRPYVGKRGSVDRLKPLKNFSLKDGGLGAWEVAARYAATDLDDNGLSGGKMNNLGLALNWYPNPNVRFMLNYVMANTRVGANSDDPQIIMLRAQVDF